MTRGRLAALSAALAFLAFPALASAAAQAATHHYYTELYRFPGAGTQGSFPVSAVLDLTIAGDGSISGYYRPTDPTDGAVLPVTGTLSAEDVSFEVGGVQGLHVNAKLNGGKLLGRAYQFYGREVFYFIVRPIPNDSALPNTK